MRISKQIRSVTAKFPAQRNRELLLLEQGILNNGTGNVFAQSGNRCRSTPIALASCRKTSLQADAGGPSPSLNRWLPHPRWAFSGDRLLRVSGRVAGLRDVWGQPLPVMRSGFDDHANFRWRARPCRIRDTRANGIGRDDGSTKLKHQSAVEIESEN